MVSRLSHRTCVKLIISFFPVSFNRIILCCQFWWKEIAQAVHLQPLNEFPNSLWYIFPSYVAELPVFSSACNKTNWHSLPAPPLSSTLFSFFLSATLPIFTCVQSYETLQLKEMNWSYHRWVYMSKQTGQERQRSRKNRNDHM